MRFHIHTIYEEGDMKPVVTSNIWMMTKKRKPESIRRDLHEGRISNFWIEGIPLGTKLKTTISSRWPMSGEVDFVYFEFEKNGKQYREKWVRIR